MEDLILMDTSVLIEYFRKKKKNNTLLYKISGISGKLYISAITHIEILYGISPFQEYFWSNFFSKITILSYTPSLNYTAVRILQQLKTKRITIEFKDLLKAAAAIQNDFKLATLNKRNFENIPDIVRITHDSFR